MIIAQAAAILAFIVPQPQSQHPQVYWLGKTGLYGQHFKVHLQPTTWDHKLGNGRGVVIGQG